MQHWLYPMLLKYPPHRLPHISAQDRGTKCSANLPGGGAGHAENGGMITQGKHAAPKKRDQEVARSRGMLQKGAAILSGPAATCILCESRAVLFPENDRSVHHSEGNALHD